MIVIEIDGQWFVLQGAVVGPFKSNADAWCWADRAEDDLSVSRNDSIQTELWKKATITAE
jgi:hypothetical protein